MIETPLLYQGAYFVVSAPEVTDEYTLEKISDCTLDNRGALAFVDHKIAPLIGGKAPEPMGDPSDPPSAFIGVEDGGIFDPFADILVERRKNLRQVVPGLGQSAGTNLEGPKGGKPFHNVSNTHADPVMKPCRHDQVPKAERHVGHMAGGGARVVEGLDAASHFGFSVPELDDASTAKIQVLLPPAGGKGGNPADLANPGIVPAVMNPTLDIFAAREDIQLMVMYQMVFYFYNNMRKISPDPENVMAPHEQIAAKAMEIRQKTGKPLALVLVDTASSPDHGDIEKYRLVVKDFYTSRGIPCFDTGNQAFSVMRRVADYYERRRIANP